MAGEPHLEVEIVYARPEEQSIVRVSVAQGSTVRDALVAARVTERWPELASGYAALGIYGRRVAADAALRAGDRIEIYRPLNADPKQARRVRAARKG